MKYNDEVNRRRPRNLPPAKTVPRRPVGRWVGAAPAEEGRYDTDTTIIVATG